MTSLVELLSDVERVLSRYKSYLMLSVERDPTPCAWARTNPRNRSTTQQSLSLYLSLSITRYRKALSGPRSTPLNTLNNRCSHEAV